MDLTAKTREIRKTVISMANSSKSPHVGSCLSCVDILATMYFGAARLEPWETRDICILSKGHAAMALYATLRARGILTAEEIAGYYQNNGTLPAHLDRFRGKGVEVSAGSLGHGFNIGLGLAYGFKRAGADRKVYAVIGDGESQEGSIWEGALFAPRLGLDNFTGIIDCNDLQGYGRPSQLVMHEPVQKRWESFGWHAIEVDGHNHAALMAAFAEESHGKPKIIIARTTKGKGVSFMEDELVWHYYIVTDEHKATAFAELAS